jgi:hypothetical protein
MEEQTEGRSGKGSALINTVQKMTSRVFIEQQQLGGRCKAKRNSWFYG